MSEIDWRAMYDAMKADRDRLKAQFETVKVDRDNIRARLLYMIKEREERTCYRVGSTLCCTCGARGDDTPSRLDDIEKRVSKLEAAKGGET